MLHLNIKSFFTIVVTLFVLLPTHAQKTTESDDEDRQPAIRAIVHNKFTGEKIDSITLTVMEMDSTIVQSFIPKSFYKWSVYDSVKRKGNFIFKFSKDGYFDAYVNAKLVAIPHRKLLNDLGYVYMRKKAKEKSCLVCFMVIPIL